MESNSPQSFYSMVQPGEVVLSTLNIHWLERFWVLWLLVFREWRQQTSGISGSWQLFLHPGLGN